MEAIIERCCGLDVFTRTTVVACVLMWHGGAANAEASAHFWDDDP